MMMSIFAAQTGGLDEMGASVAEVTDGTIEVTHLDKMVTGAMIDRDTFVSRLDEGKLCLRWKYLDKGVSPWQRVGLCKT